MQESTVLARLLGPVLLVMGIGMLLDQRAYRAMAEEFLASRALIYISGLIALVTGLVIVNFHNRWAFGWPVIITIFGWLSLIGVVVRILAPDRVKRLGSAFLDNAETMRIAGIVVVALGAILSIAGYVR
jgi:uncharacterized protein YjeT (DUF2065 family)